MINLKCEYCGKIFTHNHFKRFCSRRCQNRWIGEGKLEKRVLIECITCGKEFTVRPSRGNIARFCSRSCASKWRLKNIVFNYGDRTGKNNSNWKGGLLERICEFCGKKFIEKNRGRNSKYCSEGCYGKAKTSFGTIILKCKWCGKEYKTNYARKEKSKFCSMKCYYNYLHSIQGKKQASIRNKKNWKKQSYQEKIKIGNSIRPNKSELYLLNILRSLFPNEYKFVGDFSFVIDGKNPDFININGQKKLIELFGDYWHDPKKFPEIQTPEERIKYFKRYGFNTLIIWESELRNLDSLESKLKEFHYA